jgi:23S rRNA (uracil1939-C5)-methyltransferase
MESVAEQARPYSMDPIIQIDSLSYGRSGVARMDGKVLFVEGVAPGDRARVAITKDHGAYAEAEVVELLSRGSAHITPPCPFVESCGGCPWQHISYAEQLHAKQRAIGDALQRIAGIHDPPVEEIAPSPVIFGYRNRLHLRFENGRLGFSGAHSHQFAAVSDCLLAESSIREALPSVEAFVSSLSTRVVRVEILSRGLLPGVSLAIRSTGRLRRADAHRVCEYLERSDNPVHGVSMWGRGWQRSWGDTRRRFIADATTIETIDPSFGQVNSAANLHLIETVVQFARLDGCETVLDLYAGAGNLSLPLARRCRHVVGVEKNATAVESARHSCRFHRIKNVTFHAQEVESFLAHSVDTRPDCIVVNPPRAGIGRCAEALAALRASRIVYVSCDPVTLARDLHRLCAHGYKLRRLKPLDLFPHTYHVESVCHIGLT